MLINEFVIQIAFQAESEYEQDQVEERHRAKVHLQRELRHWPHSQLPSKFSLSFHLLVCSAKDKGAFFFLLLAGVIQFPSAERSQSGSLLFALKSHFPSFLPPHIYSGYESFLASIYSL